MVRFEGDDPLEQGPRGGYHEIAPIGHGEDESTVCVGAMVTGVLSDESAREVWPDDHHAPFAGERVVGGDVGAADSVDRLAAEADPERGDEARASREHLVASDRLPGEVPGMLERGDEDGALADAQSAILEVVAHRQQ